MFKSNNFRYEEIDRRRFGYYDDFILVYLYNN